MLTRLTRPLRLQRTTLILISALLLAAALISTAEAQKQDNRWFGPYRLSSEEGTVLANGGAIAADQYGNVHAIWAEGGYPINRFIIQYARFDGITWSVPIDIFISPEGATFGAFSSPVIDPDGDMYFAMTVGQLGPIFIFRAPATDALSARNWERIQTLSYPAFRTELQVDGNGLLHLVYSDFFSSAAGMYYLRSADKGKTWSAPMWLDPEIPSTFGAGPLDFEIDRQTGVFHLLYKYEEKLEDAFEGREIVYLRSLDSGQSWEDPKIIDLADEEAGELRANEVVMATNGPEVVVVWSGTVDVQREMIVSHDSGATWQNPVRVFGNLSGSAGDDMVTDATGDMHYLGQIRYPQGLYQISWENGGWSLPALIYLINEDADHLIGGRIHIHYIQAAVRLGNQLVLVFTDSPGTNPRFLYTMYRTLDGIAQEQAAPTPAPTPTATLEPTADGLADSASASPTPVPFDRNAPAESTDPGSVLLVAMVAVIALIAVVYFARFGRPSRRTTIR